jgi:antitoxin (DNA-binding transcriptional repressor) of toxin-antitoxin stability system
MKTTSVTRLKNHLSAHLKEVLAGETVLITDRRKPIALIRPLDHGLAGDKLAGMYERGLLAPPARPLDVAAFLGSMRGKSAEPLSSAIIEEREGR